MNLLLGAGVCATLVGGALCATAAPALACPAGTVPSDFPGVCEAGAPGGPMTADGPADGSADGPMPAGGSMPVGGGGAVLGGGPEELPSVDGVPCTPQKIGTCLGLMESQG